MAGRCVKIVEEALTYSLIDFYIGESLLTAGKLHLSIQLMGTGQISFPTLIDRSVMKLRQSKKILRKHTSGERVRGHSLAAARQRNRKNNLIYIAKQRDAVLDKQLT